jgi:two-component system chemotaxis response regulator CheB
MRVVRVLVVDDSAFMRRQLTRILEADPELEVVGIARNGEEAVEKTKALEPDVVTLDINMPVMDGLTALTYIMMERPTPCLMVSSLTQEGALATFEALELGAVDFVPKPSGTISVDIDTQAEEIVQKVRAAARARPRGGRRKIVSRSEREEIERRPTPRVTGSSTGVVAVGVSTGGPQTLLEILPFLPADLSAPVLIVQHMPPSFTGPLAKRLNDACAIQVKEAEQNEPLLPGWGYVAPGGYHLTVAQSTLGRGPVARLSDRPRGYSFCPSADVLLESVARVCGPRSVGVLLTGMGSDGADGMVRIRQAGGFTIAESEETAVVFGMPREAIERGGAQVVAPAPKIADHIVAALRRLE